MAEVENKQVSQDGKPAKKRRFFRPRPKKNPEAVNAEQKLQNVPADSKPKAKQPSKPKTAQAENANKVAKPKTANKPKAVKPIAKTAKPVAKADGKATEKTKSNFRPRKPNGAEKLRISDIDFKYLDKPDFKDIYALVTKANSYFATDKETCCTKFRIANEAIIARLIKILQLEEAVEKNTFEQINLLSEKIPSDMVDSNIFSEMHNIRMIGNSFAHNDDKYDSARGSKTCLIAMEKICRWLVEFEPKYLSYQRAKAATSMTPMQYVKTFFKTIFPFLK